MADGEQPSEELSDPDEALIQEIMNRPSSFINRGIDLSGFASEDQARLVAQEVTSCLYSFGKLLNLERLSRVVVTYDYKGTLAALDLGFKTSEPLTPTQDDLATGIAMATAILDNGEPRSVMVLNAEYMSIFAHRDKPECAEAIQRMIHTVAHECGHVHDFSVQIKAFPNEKLKMKPLDKDSFLSYVAGGCWEEYIASRLSAFVAVESETQELEETFCKALERTKTRGDAAIRQYQMHHDIPRVLHEVTHEYKRLLVYGSYLIGHIDGLGGGIQELGPQAYERTQQIGYFKPFFEKLVAHLRDLHSTYGQWKTIEVFEPLKLLVHELLKTGGMDIQQRSEGLYLEIPFSPERVPSVRERLEFISRSKITRRMP